MHRGNSKICRLTADRHSTCSVLNKTAPPVHGADGTQSIRTRFLRLFPCPDFLIALLPGAHSNTTNRRLCCSESRSELRSLLLPHKSQVVGPRAHNRVESGTNERTALLLLLWNRSQSTSVTPDKPTSDIGPLLKRYVELGGDSSRL